MSLWNVLEIRQKLLSYVKNTARTRSFWTRNRLGMEEEERRPVGRGRHRMCTVVIPLFRDVLIAKSLGHVTESSYVEKLSQIHYRRLAIVLLKW